MMVSVLKKQIELSMACKTIRLASMPFESIVDGEGLRLVIFVQGCSRDCPGCHNAEAQDPNGGFEIFIEDLIELICSTKIISGITLSGGEPFEQKDECVRLIKEIKKVRPDLNFWVYTGYLFEDLIETGKDLLDEIDVLVDGPFLIEKKSLDLKFRGSSNQRIILMEDNYGN